MSTFATLPWLARPPVDFREHCRHLRAGLPGLGGVLRALAQYALDGADVLALNRAVVRLKQEGADLDPLQSFRIGLVSNGTMDVALPALVVGGLRHGFLFDIVLGGGVGQYYQDATDPGSALRAQKLNAAVLALDYRAFGFDAVSADVKEAETQVAGAIAQLNAMREGLQQAAGVVMVQTLAPPAVQIFGNAETTLPGLGAAIQAFNQRVAAGIGDSGSVLLDVAHIASSVGLATWHDATHWNASKLPFSPDYFPLYADNLARVLAAGQGRARRCLALDLDNTLWGGVVGDDGIEGISLGQGDGTGEAFIEVQNAALALYRRGIMLTVCSKNDARIAREVFRSHPEILLKEDHFAAFYANWDNKAANLRAIAEDLNIGLESIVFLDDNPAERALVRRELPMVAVPELSDDPASYVQTLLAGGYFEALGLTEADRNRNRHYADNARRAELQAGATDVDQYLASLEMQVEISPFTAMNRARVTQLINKTNQFNVTARRTTEAEIAALEGRRDVVTMAVRLRDRFGDNGIISALICEKGQEAWKIDTWVMSCRVFQRKVEHAVLNVLAARAADEGQRALAAQYQPTPRNGVVRDLYASLGFVNVAGEAQGSAWRLNVDRFTAFDIPISVRSKGEES